MFQPPVAVKANDVPTLGQLHCRPATVQNLAAFRTARTLGDRLHRGRGRDSFLTRGSGRLNKASSQKRVPTPYCARSFSPARASGPKNARLVRDPRVGTSGVCATPADVAISPTWNPAIGVEVNACRANGAVRRSGARFSAAIGWQWPSSVGCAWGAPLRSQAALGTCCDRKLQLIMDVSRQEFWRRPFSPCRDAVETAMSLIR